MKQAMSLTAASAAPMANLIVTPFCAAWERPWPTGTSPRRPRCAGDNVHLNAELRRHAQQLGTRHFHTREAYYVPKLKMHEYARFAMKISFKNHN
jgi:hypothetical protein